MLPQPLEASLGSEPLVGGRGRSSQASAVPVCCQEALLLLLPVLLHLLRPDCICPGPVGLVGLSPPSLDASWVLPHVEPMVHLGYQMSITGDMA